MSFVGKNGLDLFAQPKALTGSETALEAGWYSVSGEVAIKSDIALSGDVKLILTDGAVLTVNGSISGDGTLTVYGQTEGTGTLNGKTVSVNTYTQYSGKVKLTSDTEFALTGSSSVSLLGGQFESNAGVSSEGTITLGFLNKTDGILAGKYTAKEVVAANNQSLYIPDLPKDLSLDLVYGSLSLTYNGEEQAITKEDMIGRVWFSEPIYPGVISDSEVKMQLAENRKLCPSPLEYDPDISFTQIPLGEDDFELVEVESAKDCAAPGSGNLAYHKIKLIGKGEYSGSAVLEWYMKAADISGEITVTPKSPFISDGSPVTAEDFEITASSPLAQGLVDEIAADKLNQSVYVIKDGERMNGCVEIDENGTLCYYMADEDGEDIYVKVEQTPNMYWYIEKNEDSESLPHYNLKQDYMEAQKTEAVKPGDYVARMIISETESSNYKKITKIIPFTIEASQIVTPPDESDQIAPDETILRWAEKDYTDKTGTY